VEHSPSADRRARRVGSAADYTVAAWFNSLLTPEFIDAVQTNNFSKQGDNLSNTLWFDGVLGRIEFRC
jgi:hypothetical protein